MKEYKIMRSQNGGLGFSVNYNLTDENEVYSSLLNLIDVYHNECNMSVSCVFYDYLCNDFNPNVKLWVEVREVSEYVNCYNEHNKILHLRNNFKKHIA